MEIQGKKAVVVGGASGMAKATAELLRQKGADVAVLDLPNSAGAEVAKALGGTFHEVDVLDENQVEAALGDAVAALGGLHIAVNTAGGGTAKRTLTKDGTHRSTTSAAPSSSTSSALSTSIGCRPSICRATSPKMASVAS